MMLVWVAKGNQIPKESNMVERSMTDFPGIECSGTDRILLNSGCKCRGRTGGTGDEEGGEELHDKGV